MDKNTDISIGTRIKNRRKEMNITQTAIQEKTGISSGNLSGIENGRYLPSTTALIGLSEVLNCSIDWILKGDSSISKNEGNFDIKESKEDAQLLDQFHALAEEDQEEILMMIQLKYNRIQKARKKEQQSSLSDPGNLADEIA